MFAACSWRSTALCQVPLLHLQLGLGEAEAEDHHVVRGALGANVQRHAEAGRPQAHAVALAVPAQRRPKVVAVKHAQGLNAKQCHLLQLTPTWHGEQNLF